MIASPAVASKKWSLSVFAVPKPFRDQIGVIQRNAIASWKALSITSEILLLGSESGVAEAAAESGASHCGEIERDVFGTPLLDDVFRVASETAARPWLCYVNCDIILMPEFAKSVRRAVEQLAECLVISRRWNLDVAERLSFSNGGHERVRATAAVAATLFSTYGIDVFVFPKGLYRTIPPFALGRSSWDNWLVGEARRRGYPVVDVTQRFGVIHQNHPYNGFSSLDDLRRSQQGLRNFWLAGDSVFGLAHSEDATHRFEAGEIVSSGKRTVSVVIPNAGSLTELCKCLRSLSQQTYPRTYIEIIVVDNAEQTVSAPALREFPYVKVTREAKPGPAAARNKGAAIATGEAIAFLDSDCKPVGEWLKTAMAVAEQNAFQCVVACNVKPWMARSGPAGVRWYEALVFHEQQRYVEDAKACITGGMLVPREVWQRVGPFDEDFVEAACEDWEWSTRASALGVRIVYAAEAVVVHPVHNTWRELRSKCLRLARGEMKLATKRANGRRPEFFAFRRSYARRLWRELKVAFSDRRLPRRFRIQVAFAAARSYFWSVGETRRRLDISVPRPAKRTS